MPPKGAVLRASRELGAPVRDLMVRGLRQSNLTTAYYNRGNAHTPTSEHDRAIDAAGVRRPN